MEQDRWSCVKAVYATVGEDVYSSWFARIDLKAQRNAGASFGATRFLKSWIRPTTPIVSWTCWQAEKPMFRHIELTVVQQCATLRPNKKSRHQLNNAVVLLPNCGQRDCAGGLQTTIRSRLTA